METAVTQDKGPAPPLVEQGTSPPTANDSIRMPQAATYQRQAINTVPLHTHTESTLAPTSEFMRYVLAALPSRYVLRGLFSVMFNEPKERAAGLAGRILNFFGGIGNALANKGWDRKTSEAAAFSTSLGLGSLWLTLSYSNTVYKDIKNIFSEAVSMEFDKPADRINIEDIRHSQNRIVQKTLENFRHRTLRRLLVDFLFFPAGWLRHPGAGDFVLGLKGVQLFAETWKRKTTMFEDLVTFVNNKINPRNGLGQPIAIGEVFDLYQHYAQEFAPQRAFTNVIEGPNGEGILWARSEPIFQRITELMNATYAYKHPSVVDPTTGNVVPQANFALPMFIYLLGHDLIDLSHPKRTQITIEVANQHGIHAVKELQTLVAKGVRNEELMEYFRISLPKPAPVTPRLASKENAVIPKGSSVQLDAAQVPLNTIVANDSEHIAPTQAHQIA